jgi:hypothetical protein
MIAFSGRYLMALVAKCIWRGIKIILNLASVAIVIICFYKGR